jgi:hypothetical protein
MTATPLTAVGRASTNSRRSRRRRTVVENDQYAAFTRRIVRAHARRVAGGDIDALPDLIALGREIETAIDTAVAGLRSFGYSWAEIATRLGISRQAAHQRWGGEPNA